MKRKFDLIIVIPIGPNSQLAYVKDTILSIEFYITCSYKIIITDDSQKGLAYRLQTFFPDIDILKTQKNMGREAGLYINLSMAYSLAINAYDFKALMKMDDDALVIGYDPQEAAIRLFKECPEAGMAGRHITGRFSPDAYNNLHDNAYPRNTLLAGTCTWKFIKRPQVNWLLRKLLLQALKNGYELGENIQGGVYFISPICIQRLEDAGLLPLVKLDKAILGEDHLFSLLTKVTGLQLIDMASGTLPIGCSWKGLPAAPGILRQHGKKVIHSIRYWEDTNEEQIRIFFRQYRIHAA